jgi:thymidylate kinase
MIVEIFGPPGVGKTTFAIALAERLRQRGVDVALAVSYRPAEVTPALHAPVRVDRATPVVVRRLTRPVLELFATASAPSMPCEADRAATLLRLLPPTSTLWRLRLRQYIRRLSRSWDTPGHPGPCIICDQAFVQLVCSLVLLTDRASPDRIVQALRSIPHPDLLIHLQAPREILQARLIERDRRQSVLERLLEFDLATNLRSVEVLEEIDLLLTEQGRSIIRLASTDTPALGHALAQIAGIVMEQRRAKGLVA